MTTATDALTSLRALVGRPEAEFHDGQFEAISALVDDHRRVLVVQRTGWGKSAVYFVATRLLRDAGAGPTLIVSPLLPLMRNQIDAGALDADVVDVLLVSPERFANAAFRADVLPRLAPRVGMLVVDEVHCISD